MTPRTESCEVCGAGWVVVREHRAHGVEMMLCNGCAVAVVPAPARAATEHKRLRDRVSSCTLYGSLHLISAALLAPGLLQGAVLSWVIGIPALVLGAWNMVAAYRASQKLSLLQSRDVDLPEPVRIPAERASFSVTACSRSPSLASKDVPDPMTALRLAAVPVEPPDADLTEEVWK